MARVSFNLNPDYGWEFLKIDRFDRLDLQRWDSVYLMTLIARIRILVAQVTM